MAADHQALSLPIILVDRCAAATCSSPEHDIAKLLAANPRVKRYSDPYRALAMLLQHNPHGTGFAHAASAVIVCIDDWSEEEFDFFRLCRTARPEIPTLVYTTLHDHRHVDCALRAGAAGRATETEINLLLTTESPARTQSPGAAASAPLPIHLPPTAPPKVPPPDQPEPTRTTIAPAPIAPPQAAPPTSLDLELEDDELPPLDADEELVTDGEAPHDEELVGEDVTEESLSDDDGETPARVPWLRYNDQPLRMSPGARVPPAGPTRTPPENGTAGNERHTVKPAAPMPAPRPAGPPPLLSEEELRALLADDVSALAPQEENPRQREPRSQGL